MYNMIFIQSAIFQLTHMQTLANNQIAHKRIINKTTDHHKQIHSISGTGFSFSSMHLTWELWTLPGIPVLSFLWGKCKNGTPKAQCPGRGEAQGLQSTLAVQSRADSQQLTEVPPTKHLHTPEQTRQNLRATGHLFSVILRAVLDG